MVYLKDDKYIVVIDDIVLETHPTGIPKFHLSDQMCSGWWDSAGIKREKLSRASGWGDFRSEQFREARLITWTGTAVASSAVELQAMRDEFTGLLHSKNETQLRVYSESTGNRYATVSLEDAPVWERLTDSAAIFQLKLYSPNPRIYGDLKEINLFIHDGYGGIQFPIEYDLDFNETTAEATKFLVNGGNTNSYPTIEIQGEFPAGFKLTDGRGKWFTFSGTVTQASPVTIDSRTGRVTQKGISRSALVESTQNFVVGPLEQIQPRVQPISPTSYGYAKFSLRDTFI